MLKKNIITTKEFFFSGKTYIFKKYSYMTLNLLDLFGFEFKFSIFHYEKTFSYKRVK